MKVSLSAKYLLSGLLFSCLLFEGCFQVPDQHHIVGSQAEYEIAIDSEQVCTSEPGMALLPGEGLDAGGFKVLSWNLYKGNKDGWLSDLKEMVRESDLILLQEGYLQEELLTFLNENELHWNLAAAFTYQDIHAGVLTASKVAPEMICSTRTPEPLFRLPKTSMITRYPLANTEASLMVANVHSVNFTTGLEAFEEQFAKVVELLKDHPGPMILAGDFNTWREGRLEVVAKLAEELDLRPLTFVEDRRRTTFGHPLDHLYYRGLIAQNPQTVEVDSSDHNPVQVTFKVGTGSPQGEVL